MYKKINLYIYNNLRKYLDQNYAKKIKYNIKKNNSLLLDMMKIIII